jgi:signal transduction histidine kinase
LWVPGWSLTSAVILIGLGCVMLAVAWLNRGEVYFSYFGWLCLAWVAMSLVSEARDLPWSNEVAEFMLASFWTVLLAFAIQFLLSFAGLRSRPIEDVITLQCVVMPVSLLLAGSAHLFAMTTTWHVIFAVELTCVAAIYLAVTMRQRPGDYGPMALVIGLGWVSLVAEIGAELGLLEEPSASIAEVVLPLVLVAVGTRLFLMFATALRSEQGERKRLDGELRHLGEDIDARVERLTAHRVEQFAEHEHRRIAADLHDDLGAKLLTIVHTRDGARVPQLAREALEEMRLSVRGLAGRPVNLADALADWRAETIGRLVEANIEGRWENGNGDASHRLSARVFMQLTRILREAVNNVIKHSSATRCEVRWQVVDDELRMAVVDNGCGIAADLRRGHGMSSMKRRARKMDGQCLVASRPGSGVAISVAVPL